MGTTATLTPSSVPPASAPDTQRSVDEQAAAEDDSADCLLYSKTTVTVALMLAEYLCAMDGPDSHPAPASASARGTEAGAGSGPLSPGVLSVTSATDAKRTLQVRERYSGDRYFSYIASQP